MKERAETLVASLLIVVGAATASSCEGAGGIRKDAGHDQAVDRGATGGTGGASKTGGGGGTSNTGAVGGATGSGGSSGATGSGGSSGATGSGGSSGATGSGGSSGATGSGGSSGATGSGGSSGPNGSGGNAGATGTGGGAAGVIGSGGSGGAPGSGGATSSGGVTSSGGATSSGGVTSSGGATGSGGVTSSGGAPASGGSGGATGAGGTAGATGSGGTSGGAGGSGNTGGHNLVFVTSRRDLHSDLGNAAAYDTLCNQLATTAGINEASGDAFVAMVADSHSSPLTRLGNARGFVRTDGAPVADDLPTLFSQNKILNPIITNEYGVAQPLSAALTGLGFGGIPDPTTTCSDYTTATGPPKFIAGCSSCGGVTWYYWQSGTCDFFVGSVYCFMKTKTAPLIIAPVAGKKIFVTNGPVFIGQDANAKCEASKPAGTGAVSALRSTTTAAAATLIVPTAKYVRPDGIFVALGSDLVQAKLSSGVWQQGDGTYLDSRAVWTGSATMNDKGTTASTCTDWTSATQTQATTGGTSPTDAGFWRNADRLCNNQYTWSYCVER